MKQKANIYT